MIRCRNIEKGVSGAYRGEMNRNEMMLSGVKLSN
nr:MAG TPA: hypothetical protein [Caudoviricetes sp.]